MTNPEPPPSAARRWNTRLGLFLFFVYLMFYLGFVLTSAFAPDMMERIVGFGLNLAVVYGFALIGIALLMAVAYGLMCRAEPSASIADPPNQHKADNGQGEVE